ncbi:putative DnaJ domain-containing protein [Lupinus albus]|uniref:Putative DnaJ domain-containing protein n=1 Tax=Lupinus albus TaxID=3870 RepID=A0A6A4Q4W1_LUPAL|nr:putative DnaJ domain-containing protein [Lupinus albus]
MMDCNKDEAARAKEIAERKFSEREYVGAKKFALKALNLYPALEDLSQFLTTLNIYISAENKISGEMDWYGILGVSPFADDETVRKQYRKLALTLHPDKNKTLGAEGAFKLVSEAWSLLSDKTKRLAYNQKRTGNNPNHIGSQSAAHSSNGIYNFKKNVTSNMRTGTNARAPSAPVPPPQKRAETFWTICNRCKTHYEYLRVYLNNTLLCPNCNEAFMAVETGPPPNVFKSPNWSSRQQHHNNRQHGGTNNTNVQWDSHGSSSVAAQIVQQASEKVRRDGSKKRRTDDIHINGYQGHMANHMGMGHGAAGVGSFSEPGKANMETQRINGFSGKHYRTRELSMFELRNMLMDKARVDISKKLQEWRSVAEAKITNKDRGNKRQKSTFNDKASSEKHVESTDNGNRRLVVDSFPVTSDDAVEKNQAYVTINVPDPDFHNFDLDRSENVFEDDQVWAAYDDDDGMPRYYARIHKVISTKPFRMQIRWLNSRSNTELGPIDWIGSGFYKTCGDFRAGKHELSESLNSFSHKVRWTKGNRGVIRIFPGKGEVWALYRNWSPDWNEHTPDEVIHKYDMVEVLDDFSEEQGIIVTPLIKVAGFRTVFQRHMDPDQVRRIQKEEMFRFSHQIPNYLLTGQEASNSPKGCRELDPAATPSPSENDRS